MVFSACSSVQAIRCRGPELSKHLVPCGTWYMQGRRVRMGLLWHSMQTIPWLLACSIVFATWYTASSILCVVHRTGKLVRSYDPSTTRTGIPGAICYRLSGRKKGGHLTRDHGFCSEEPEEATHGIKRVGVECSYSSVHTVFIQSVHTVQSGHTKPLREEYTKHTRYPCCVCLTEK